MRIMRHLGSRKVDACAHPKSSDATCISLLWMRNVSSDQGTFYYKRFAQFGGSLLSENSIICNQIHRTHACDFYWWQSQRIQKQVRNMENRGSRFKGRGGCGGSGVWTSSTRRSTHPEKCFERNGWKQSKLCVVVTMWARARSIGLRKMS